MGWVVFMAGFSALIKYSFYTNRSPNALKILMEFLILDFEMSSNNDQKCLIFGDKLTHFINKFNDFKVFADFI